MTFHSLDTALQTYQEVFNSEEICSREHLESLYFSLEKQIANLYEELCFCRSRKKEELFDFLILFSEKTFRLLQQLNVEKVA